MCGPAPCASPSCTWGEQHRIECEAREVMKWSRETRQDYYAKVKAKRGELAMRQLVEEVKRQWQR